MNQAVFSQVPSVSTLQNMNFGAFSQGSSGGTLTINADGSRSATGTVVPLSLGQSFQPAIILVKAPAGTIISLSNGPDVFLSGSNGGSMQLTIGQSVPFSPFIAGASTGETQVTVGGMLSVGNAAQSPPGVYSGTFFITFNNE
jgi:hypothetical protein